MVSTNAFHSANIFLFSCHHIPTNNIAPFSAYKYTHNPQFLQLLRWRAFCAQNVSFYTPYSGQFTLSTQSKILNYSVILSHWCSTTVSLEIYPLYLHNSPALNTSKQKKNSSVLVFQIIVLFYPFFAVLQLTTDWLGPCWVFFMLQSGELAITLFMNTNLIRLWVCFWTSKYSTNGNL